MSVIPNTFIVGAQKSATTSLLRWLGEFKEVDPGYLKELGLLCFDDESVLSGAFSREGSLARKWSWKENKEEILEAYSGFFGAKDGAEVVIDASVLYMPSRIAAARIAEIQPTGKIIALIREPMARANSALAHHVQRFRALPNLDDLSQANDPLGILTMGDYLPQLRRYYDHFPKEQIFVRTFEQFCREGETVLSELGKFLGLPDAEKSFSPERRNTTLHPRFGSKNTIKLLELTSKYRKESGGGCIHLEGLKQLKEFRAEQGSVEAKSLKRRLRKRLERVLFTENRSCQVKLPERVFEKNNGHFLEQRSELVDLVPEADLTKWWGSL